MRSWSSKGNIGSGDIVEPLPFLLFSIQIHVFSESQKLIEFLYVGTVGSLDPTVEVR